MVSFRSSFIPLATVINVASTFSIGKRSLPDLNEDFETLKADPAAVTNDVSSPPRSGIDGLNARNTNSLKLIADVQQTASDVTSTSFLDEANAASETLLTRQTQALVPATENISPPVAPVTPASEELYAKIISLFQQTEETLEQFAVTFKDLNNGTFDSNNATEPEVQASQRIVETSALATAIASSD